VGRVMVASAGGPRSVAAEERSLALVEQRLARRERVIRRLRAAVVMAVMVGGGAYWGRVHYGDRSGQEITYELRRGLTVGEGDLVASAANTEPADLRFSDGTLVRMEPRTRGRVLHLDRNGATVALYDGKAHVEVQHRANARWLFDAGPFQVRVHGTAFSMSWNAATAHFDLQMESGVVSVTGPISGGEVVLQAGQKLSVTLSDHETAPAPASAPAPIAASTVRPADRAVLLNKWRAELAEGHASAVIAEAQRSGLGRVLEIADVEDLAALADAARYVGKEDLARRILHTERRRFPGSKRAADAAFLLGRLEDESPPGVARALAWYDRYLTEAPSGAYASEALGRKMTVLERSGQHENAVAVARLYLRRFCTGSYAHAATVLVDPSALASGLPRTP
jgi:TolA-binding protein